MISIVDQMLTVYDVKTIYDQKNAMKEVMQEIVLCGLSRIPFCWKTTCCYRAFMEESCKGKGFI